MSAEQRSVDQMLRLLGEAQERLDAARNCALKGSFRASDIEHVLAAEEQLQQLRDDAGELRKALRATVHVLAKAVRDQTKRWPELPDGRQVKADWDSPHWRFIDEDAAQRFLNDVAAKLVDLAPASGVVEWTVKRLAEVFPLARKSIPVTHRGATALSLDITEYRESAPGAIKYTVIAPKPSKGIEA